MSKNLIPEIARMLGVELGEKFKIKGGVGTYEFGLEGLWGDYGTDAEALEAILCGSAEVVKLPWKPKEGESFYTFTAAYGEWSVSLDMWAEEPCNYALLDKGWIYRTEKEAIAALPTVLKELSERRKS